MNNQISKEVARDLGTIIANQSLDIAALKVENQNLKQRNIELQQINNELRKKVKPDEPKTNNAEN